MLLYLCIVNKEICFRSNSIYFSLKYVFPCSQGPKVQIKHEIENQTGGGGGRGGGVGESYPSLQGRKTELLPQICRSTGSISE